MNPFTIFKQLYSLDTLDSRFTTSSTTPVTSAEKEKVEKDTKEKDGPSDTTLPPGALPAKWKTPEFYFYAVVFIVVVPQMFKAVMDVSQESHPGYKRYGHLLSPGWIGGRKVDNSDAQYASFRNNIPYMAIVLLVHPQLRRLYNRLFPLGSGKAPANGHASKGSNFQDIEGDQRMKQRISYDLYFGLIFVTVLHGVSVLKILFLLYINYSIATRLPKSYVTLTTWMFNISLLFFNEWFRGYPFTNVVSTIAPFADSAIAWAQALDSYGGLIPRWEVLFKITILRMISFNLDYLWSLDRRAASPVEKKQLDPSALSERDRVSIPPPPSTFSPHNYVAYILYSPLYLAGPIINFNDYIAQSRHMIANLSRYRTFLYAIRFFTCLFIMEFLLHYLYTVAISKGSPDWSIYTPFQLAMLGYFNLHIIWLKLLIPWRFFRMWSLVDHIDPPENMVRCMSNNYSAMGFWRGWHRSFNRWTVRYIYVPLGGGVVKGNSRFRTVLNFLAVFTFVAIWHDINLRLLMWGWLITLFVLPEILATMAFPARKWKDRPDTYRVLCGIGAVFNVVLMMVANLVGFAIGLDGLQGLVHSLFDSWKGMGFFILACGALFVGVQVMFEVRESEKRKGIKLKC